MKLKKFWSVSGGAPGSHPLNPPLILKALKNVYRVFLPALAQTQKAGALRKRYDIKVKLRRFVAFKMGTQIQVEENKLNSLEFFAKKRNCQFVSSDEKEL